MEPSQVLTKSLGAEAEQIVLPQFLPTLDTSAIARCIATKTNNPDIQAQLLFLSGQYILVTTEGDRTDYKFVSPNSVKEAFVAEPTDSGFLPVNTVRWGHNSRGEYLVQFYPPKLYQFALTNFADDSLIMLNVPMPGLLFAGCDRNYWLWATATKKFDAEAKLYNAPLPNISGGTICFGDNKPAPCSPLGIAHAWKMLWLSPFSDHSTQNKSKNEPADVRKSLLNLHNRKARRYPIKDLVPVPYRTINDAVTELIRQ